jgi:hypothetical protein
MKKQFIKSIVFSVFALFLFSDLMAQKPTVSFDYAKENFNENQPLPAEVYFTITSPISKQVMAVGVDIYRGKDSKKNEPLYSGLWKRNNGNLTEVFYLPVNYKLRGNDEYDFVLNYFRKVTEKEQTQVSSRLYQLLQTYTDQAFEKGKKVDLIKNTSQTIADYNQVVNTALARYKNASGITFPGFSDLVKNKIERLEDVKFSKKDSMNYNQQRGKALQELNDILKLEVAFVESADWLTIADSKNIDNYPVEKTRNILTVQIGYGGAYLDGDIDNFTYGAAPKVGLVFPLGNSAFTSRFWSKTAIVAGIYLEDFEDEFDNKISGPVVKKPIYAGLGYNIFRFVRLNAGVSILESKQTVGGNLSTLENRVFVRPFISLTADINLWIDLAK